jgi:hypothetical protein
MSDLKKYDAMLLAIDEVHSVDEAKNIRDQAVALKAYAREALNRDAERKCAEIRVRAERRTGELLAETARNGQRHKGHGDQKSESRRSTPITKLQDHGISKDQSSDWQKLAAIPKKQFEEELRKLPGACSTHAILGAAERARAQSKSGANHVASLVARHPERIIDAETLPAKDPAEEIQERIFKHLDAARELATHTSVRLPPIIRKLRNFADQLEALDKKNGAELAQNVDALGVSSGRN